MTNYVGYSKIPKVTGAQWAELNDRLHAGELSKLSLGSDGTAYFRRAKAKSYDDIAATIEPFRPGPTDPADRRVPRQAKPLEAPTPHQVTAAAEPDYTGEDEPDPVNWSAMITFWILAAMFGAILAIAYQTWKPS